MFSIGILSIASLGVISVLTYGLMTGDTAGNFSTATQLGREVIEVIRTDQQNLDIFPPTGAPAGLIDASVSTTPRQLINAAPLDDPDLYALPTDERFSRNIQVTAVNANFVRIQVRIYWIQNGVEKMVETVAFMRGAP